MNLLHIHKTALENACAKHNVKKLYAFGSILTSRFNSKSDIDFIVSLLSKDPLEYAENYFELKFELERILSRKIDLLEEKAIKNKTFKQLINQQKQLVYATGSESLA